MKIIVIGLGSMGKRRIRLLNKINESNIVVGVDGREDRRKEATDLYGINTYESIQAAIDTEKDIECALVCTAPLAHSAIITECLENKLHTFTEINLVSDGYEKNIQLAKKNNVELFLSSTFLYREEIQYIDNYLKEKGKTVNYVYHIGQYLPTWHPWETYKDFFVADKRTNGCREIMAIELPWLTEVFGKVEKGTAVSDKMSELNIDYNDNYMIQIQHENGNKGALIVDVVSPKAVRNLTVYGEGIYLSWDGSPTGLKKYENDKYENVNLYESVDQMENYSSFVVENAYANELEEFFNIVTTRKKARYGFEKDLEVLKLIDKIEG